MINALVHLSQYITNHFNLDELQALCFALRVDYEDLGEGGKTVKVLKLLLVLGSQRRFDELLNELRRTHPKPFNESGLNSDPAMLDSLYAVLPISSVTHFISPDVIEVPPTAQKPPIPENDNDDKGLLDFILEGAHATKVMTQTLNEHSKEAAKLAHKLNTFTNSLRTASERGNVSQIAKISSAASMSMNQYSKAVEESIVPTLKRNVKLQDENVLGYIIIMAELMKEPNHKEIIRLRIIELHRGLSALLKQNEKQLKSTIKFRREASQKGTTRESNRARRRLSKAIEQLMEVYEMVEAFCNRNLRLINEYFENLQTL